MKEYSDKILIIDDKQDNLVTAKAVLKSRLPSIAIELADSGKTGLEMARTFQPDTIILDLKMPEMDGFEVLRRLKDNNETKNIPVLLLTAVHTDSESKIRGLDLGADYFLSKPIVNEELVAQVKVLLRIKKSEDRLRLEKDDSIILAGKKTLELADSIDSFTDLIEELPDCFLHFDKDLKLAGGNKAGFECILKIYNVENLIGLHLSEILPEIVKIQDIVNKVIWYK